MRRLAFGRALCQNSTVPPPDGVTPEEAAAVFRRAAELDGGEANRGALLDAAALEEIGSQAGLSVDSVRTAVAEFQAGALAEPSNADGLFWRIVASKRVITAARGDVAVAIEDLAHRNLLDCVSHSPQETLWARKSGLGAGTARRLGGKRRYPLVAVRELRTSVSERSQGSGRLLVHLEAVVRITTRASSARRLRLPAVGAATGVGIILVGLPLGEQDPTMVEAMAGGAAVVLGSAAGAGVRTYRDAVVGTQDALDAFLDRLDKTGGEISRPRHTPLGHASR